MFERYGDYRTAWENACISTPEIPLNIDIELSTACNLSCPFCFHSSLKKNFRPERINTAMALEIIQQAAGLGVPALKFNWRGEPTLHKDFSYILIYAGYKNNFHDLIVNTNGNFFENSFEGMMAATKVVFSLDSLDIMTYKDMRRGGDMFQVVRNIEGLLKLGHSGIILQRVITKKNQKENFKNDVESLFGKTVKVSEHFCFDRNPKNKYGVGLACAKERKYCGYPSQRLIFSVNGDIFPCCIDYSGSMKLGTFPKVGIAQAWAGWRRQGLEKILRGNKKVLFPKACRNCTSWAAYADDRRENLKMPC